MAVDAQGLFGSVVHDADPNPIAARGLFASVVHSGILNPVAARGLFASVVHGAALLPVDARGLFASVVHEGTAAGGGQKALPVGEKLVMKKSLTGRRFIFPPTLF